MRRKSRGIPSPDPRASVADRLHSAAVHLLRRVRRADSESGISAARLSALSVLVFGGPRSLGDLAEAEQVRAPTMSRIVRALEAGGWVRRGADPGDVRRVRLSATARGRRFLEAGRRRRIRHLEAEIGRLRPEELHCLGQAAQILEGLFGPGKASPRAGETVLRRRRAKT